MPKINRTENRRGNQEWRHWQHIYDDEVHM